ncbi:ribosome bioproteinsis protein ytm1 [Rhodotorula toruloides]
MPALDQFLSDIGAGSLSQAIQLPPPGADTEGPAAKLHKRLEEEILATNDKTLDLLKENWDDFSTQLKTGDELIAKLEQEERDLKSLEEEVDGPDAFLPPLVAHLEQQQNLAASHLLSTASVSLLSALLAFHTTTSTLASATTSGSLPSAVDALRQVTSAVEQGAEEWIEQTDVWRSLVRWAGEEDSRLEAALYTALESCFDISPASPGNGNKATLALRERVTAAPDGPQLSVQEVLSGLEEVAEITGRPSQIEGFLATLVKQVLRHFVAPYLEANGGSRNGAKVAFSFEKPSEGVHVATLASSNEKEHDTIAGLSSFLTIFTSHSSIFPADDSQPPSRYAATLTAHLTPSLQSHLISSHLAPNLPSSTSDFTAYLSLLSAASDFESTFLSQHHLFAFLPASTRQEGHEVEEQRVIRSWTGRVPHHWARHVGDAALSRIRNVVKGWDWAEGEMVEVEVREEEEMLGLLLGLGLAEDDDEDAIKKLPRELVLQTVPRGAKRELTKEEALAPKPPRPRTPTTPPPEPPVLSPPPPPETVAPEAVPKPTLKRGKLGAAKIAAPLPPRSPSPPPLFQGGDAPTDTPESAPAFESSTASSAEPVVEEAADEPVAPPAQVEDAQPATFEAHPLDLDAVEAPTPQIDETFEPFEAPAPTAAGIETTADQADPEDVVQPHEYRAQVHDGIGEEEEVKKEEEDGADVALNDVEQMREKEKPQASAQAEREDQDELAHVDETLEDSHDLARDGEEEAKPFIKEESVEPQIPPTPQPPRTQAAASSWLDDQSQSYQPQPYQPDAYPSDSYQPEPYQPQPYEPETSYQPYSPYEPEQHPQLDFDYAREEEADVKPFEVPDQHDPANDFFHHHVSDSIAPTYSPVRDAENAQAFQPETQADAPAVSIQETYQPEENAPHQAGHGSYEQSGESAFQHPATYDDEEDPYADEQQQWWSYEPTSQVENDAAASAPTLEDSAPSAEAYDLYAPSATDLDAHEPPSHDDFFSPHQESRQAPEQQHEMPAPQQAYASYDADSYDPYAPTQAHAPSPPTRAEDQRDAYFARSQAGVHMPPSAPAPPPPSTVAPPPAGSAPPPPKASGSARPRSSASKRRVFATDGFSTPPIASALVQPPQVLSPPSQPPRTIVSPPPEDQQASYVPMVPSAPVEPVPPLRQAATASAPTTRPSSAGFSRSLPGRPSSAQRQDGPILNHIQQRFVSPPPTIANPYVPMSLPPSAQPQIASSSSYIPANDPLFADLLGGSKNSSRPAANYFVPDPPGPPQRSSSASSHSSRSAPQDQHQPAYSSQYASVGYDYQPQRQQQSYAPQQQPYAPQGDGESFASSYNGYEQDSYSPYGYEPPQHSAMRLRGGGEGDFEEGEDEEVDEDAPHLVLRLRGGADLGDMDEDDGNRSADDWGFGDDTLPDGGDDDGWGFGDEVVVPPTPPSPLPASQPHPAVVAASTPATEPPKPSVTRHVPSASISSATSASTISPRSRPSSYAYSPAVAAASRPVSLAPPPPEEQAEEVGDDAWGFDDELEAPSPASETAQISTVSAPEAHPPLDQPQSTTLAEIPSASPAASVPAAPHLDLEAEEQAPGTGGVDEWGFGADEFGDEGEQQPQPVDELVVTEDAEELLDYERAVESNEGVRASPPPATVADEVVDAEVAPSFGPTSPVTPLAQDAPADAEELQDDGWGLDDREEVSLLTTSENEPVAPLEAPIETSDTLIGFISLPPAPPDDGPNDEPDPPSHKLDAFTLENAPEEQRDDGSAATQPASISPDAQFQQEVRENVEAPELETEGPMKTRDSLSAASPPAERSALNAPPKDIDEPFPAIFHPEEPDTPRIATPLPHHDAEQPSSAALATEQSLFDIAAGPVEDAAVVADGENEDGWGLTPEDEEDQGALTATVSFLADRKEADAQNDVFPAVPAVIERAGMPDDGDFADFDAPQVSETTGSHGWEPLEDPGQQISSPPLPRTHNVEHDHEDVPVIADSVNVEPFAQEQVALQSSGSTPDQPPEASISSPEVIDHADAWDIDGEGAEPLEADEEVEEAHDGVHDSTVQHELDRPTQRDDSAVQHEAMRPIVDDAVVVPGILLPAQDAHPQQRTFTPPPTFLPDNDAAPLDSQDDAAAVDDEGGAEVLEEPDFEAQEGPEPIEGESTVQHQSQRSVALAVDVPHEPLAAEEVHPQQHTFSPPLDTLPHENDAVQGWDLNEEAQDGAAVLEHAPSIDVEEPAPPVPGESAVQHVAERHVVPAVGDTAEVLPAELLQPERHTFSPPPTSVPHEEQATISVAELADDDAGSDDPWDLEPVEPQPESVTAAAPAAEVLGADEDAAHAETHLQQHESDVVGDSALFADTAPSATVTQKSAEGDMSADTALAASQPASAPSADETSVPPLSERASIVQHIDERPVAPGSVEGNPAALEPQPQEHTFNVSREAVPSSSAKDEEADQAVQTSTSASASGDEWSWDDLQDSSSPRHAPVPLAKLPPASELKPREAPEVQEPTETQEEHAAAPNPSAHTSSKSIDEWKWDGDDTANLAAAPVTQAAPPHMNGAGANASTPAPAEPAEPSPSPVRREKMMVSKRSREIVKIAQEVLLEACHVADPSFEHPDFSVAVAPLLQTFVSLLSLYRATAAVHNSNLLASVPAIGMQFANDAEWIGREVERIWREASEGKDLQVTAKQAREVELAFQSTRQLGRDTRRKQIAIQRAALMESLDEANGFLRTSDDAHFSACERALQQVTHTLHRLSLVWKPVMTPTALYTTLGGLVNEVLLRVLDEIEDQTDISEAESVRLNKLCKMLHELESLFDGSETTAGREVPVWYKFCFLSELLEASMADIMFLFDHSHLVDFSPQEIVKLIRALFADSPLRNQNIEKIITQGHPAAPPEEEDW